MTVLMKRHGFVDRPRLQWERHAGALASLTPGRTGNLSVRRDDRIAITPTGVAYGRIEPADVSVVSLDGEHLDGLQPSSETPMHRAVYRAFDAGAIAHTHSPWATTLAVLGEPLPPVHYMIALAGSSVPVADYATYGTEALAANAVAAMREADSRACLLANHGLLACGEDAAGAVETARAVESTAGVCCRARAIGEPVVLPDEEIDAVALKLGEYGQQ